MDDLVIRLTDNTGNDLDDAEIDELIDKIGEIAGEYGLKPRQWGSIEPMTLSLTKEKEYIEKLEVLPERPEWPDNPILEDDGVIG